MTMRDVIETYYGCVNSGDWDRWLTLFHDDVEGDEQLAGHFKGIDVLRGARDSITTGYSVFKMHPQRILVDGDSACVIWRCEAANRAGTPIAYPNDPQRAVIGVNHFDVRDGRITYMRTVHDSLPFAPFINQNQPTG